MPWKHYIEHANKAPKSPIETCCRSFLRIENVWYFPKFGRVWIPANDCVEAGSWEDRNGVTTIYGRE
jgi:hypothetical protein